MVKQNVGGRPKLYDGPVYITSIALLVNLLERMDAFLNKHPTAYRSRSHLLNELLKQFLDKAGAK